MEREVAIQIFLDTVSVADVKRLTKTGLINGVTTNPSLAAKANTNYKDLLKEMAEVVDGPISAQVTAPDAKGMIAEGQQLSRLAQNIVVKLPITMEGLEACTVLSAQGIYTNMTLCFSATQALLAQNAGALFVSPFIGRFEDHGGDGTALLGDVVKALEFTQTSTLASSLRTVEHVNAAILAQVDAMTVSPALFEKMVHHDLTVQGLDKFMADWDARQVK